MSALWTRRQFGLGAVGVGVVGGFSGVALGAPRTTVGGVRMALESYSLAAIPHEGAIDSLLTLMVELNLKECSLYEPLVQPAEVVEMMRKARGSSGIPTTAEEKAAFAEAGTQLRKWRMSVSLDMFRELRKRFEAKGIDLYAYSPSGMSAVSSDAELERTVAITKALGARVVTTGMPKSVAKRFAPMAEKAGLVVGIEGRPNANSTDADSIATPADFAEAVGYSKNYGIDLDVGDATGGGFDVLAFVRANHARITGFNLKDRKKDRTSMPWGEGETPVAELLRMVQKERYPIRCSIDCDYATAAGGSRLEDIKKCLRYAEGVLKG